MKQITLSQHTLETALQGDSGNYYIITEEINIPPDGLDFPQGSVLEFRGGSFKYEPPSNVINAPIETTVRLNGSIVSAPAYGIFPSNVQVSGFANSLIHADWFSKGYSLTGSEENYINRALEAAKGCPVTLEHRTYNLLNPIKIKHLYASSESGSAYYNHHTPQTLIVPGKLKLNNFKNFNDDIDRAAIEVSTHNAIIDINEISGYSTRVNVLDPVPGTQAKNVIKEVRGGVGIRLLGDNYHLNINVRYLHHLDKGFDINPTVTNFKADGTPASGSGIQYCQIKFNQIEDVEYGFYIDPYRGNYVDKDAEEHPLHTWFNENHIEGGQLSGTNGIYCVERPSIYEGIITMDGLVFENIGLEGLTGLPMRLCNMSGCKFLNFRTMESLPGIHKDEPYDSYATWVELRNLQFCDISFKGRVDPTRIKIGEGTECKAVIIDGWLNDTPGGYHARFDRLVAMPLRHKDNNGNVVNSSKFVAYSSVNPYNMTCKTLKASEVVADGDTVPTTRYTLADILPYSYKSSVNDNGDKVVCEFNVLPCTVNAVIDKNNILLLDLSGASDFAPSVIDVCAYISESGQLDIKCDGYIKRVQFPEDSSTVGSCTHTGLYRLTWDVDWNIIVSEIWSEEP